jgi:hypothetical protein
MVVNVTTLLPYFPCEPYTVLNRLWAPLHTCRHVTFFLGHARLLVLHNYVGTRHLTSRRRYLFH